MLNCFTAVGRVARRKTSRTATGTLICRFSLAIARDKDKNGEIKTDFINCTIIGNTGIYFDNYAEVGAMLSIQGSIRTQLYEKDGQKQTIYECLIQSYKILLAAGAKPQQQTPAPAPAAQPDPVPPPQTPPPVVAQSYPSDADMLPFDIPADWSM